MTNAKKIPSTQDHLDIDDIRDDLVVLKNGGAVAVLQTNAVNFDLLSEAEQDAMIFAYASLLNSLTFPINLESSFTFAWRDLEINKPEA